MIKKNPVIVANKNDNSQLEFVQNFQKFSKKILEQLQMFSALQLQIERLIADSSKSPVAQRKLKRLEEEHFFEKNEQLFLVLENFCKHLSTLSKQIKPASASRGARSRLKLKETPVEAQSPANSPLKSTAAIKTDHVERRPRTNSAATLSAPSPSSTKKPNLLLQKRAALKLPKPKKNIISLPGGFI